MALYEFILIGPLFNVLTEAINYMPDVALAGFAFSANNLNFNVLKLEDSGPMEDPSNCAPFLAKTNKLLLPLNNLILDVNKLVLLM